jgi:hypothetical protein
MFHKNLHEVTISVIACNATEEVLEAFHTLERVEVMHLKSAQAFRSKDNAACNVSVNTHAVQGCTYYGTLYGFTLVE